MADKEISIPREDVVRFVQLYVGEEVFFKIGRTKEESYRQVLQRAQSDLVLNSEIRPIISKIGRILEGNDYQVVGMGFCQLLGDTFCISGESNSYQMKPNKDHLNKIKPYLPKGLEIKILE